MPWLNEIGQDLVCTAGCWCAW